MPTSDDHTPTDRTNLGTHPWRRYVALGDSFTEGIGDPEPGSPGGHRGWADRVAEVLSQQVDDFAYANLAVRGKLIAQIVADQVEPALALKPDLITFSAGGNDVIRPGTDPDQIATAVRGRGRAAQPRRSDDRRVHRHRHRLHAGVPPVPRQGGDLQREHPRHRRKVRLHRRRPVGAQGGAGSAILRSRPPPLQLARASRGRPDGAARPERAERPAADAARPASGQDVARRARPGLRLGPHAFRALGPASRVASVLWATRSPRSAPTRCRSGPSLRRRTPRPRRESRSSCRAVPRSRRRWPRPR